MIDGAHTGACMVKLVFALAAQNDAGSIFIALF